MTKSEMYAEMIRTYNETDNKEKYKYVIKHTSPNFFSQNIIPSVQQMEKIKKEWDTEVSMSQTINNLFNL